MITAVESTSTLLSFYDGALSVNNQTTIVTCCGVDLIPHNVSCGRGVSCSGQCSAKDASLCPSGICKNCEQGLQLEEEQTRSSRFSKLNLPSWVSWRCPSLCRSSTARPVLTRYWPLCCFNPTCKAMGSVHSKCKRAVSYSSKPAHMSHDLPSVQAAPASLQAASLMGIGLARSSKCRFLPFTSMARWQPFKVIGFFLPYSCYNIQPQPSNATWSVRLATSPASRLSSPAWTVSTSLANLLPSSVSLPSDSWCPPLARWRFSPATKNAVRSCQTYQTLA